MDSNIVDVENTLINVERQSDESSFLQAPELGEPMNIPPVLQTPTNEDRNPKRNREEASSSAMETTDEQFEINYKKRPKLNPVTEQEDTIESVEITDTDIMGKEAKAQQLQEKHSSLQDQTLSLLRDSSELRFLHSPSQWINKRISRTDIRKLS